MIYNQHAQLESYGLQTMVKEHRKNDLLKLIPCPNCGRKSCIKMGIMLNANIVIIGKFFHQDRTSRIHCINICILDSLFWS